jgi:serine/threonine protein kinase/tetratricopeptide (TPR) repeat protein
MSGATPTEEEDRSPSLGGRVEAMCDRFEAAWKAGRRPPIEDYLREVPEPGRAALLRALLELELAYRRQHGEGPTPEEYQSRFPEHVAVIETVLGAAPPPRAARPRAGADDNLLFGLLALQNNFIDRDTLVAAFAAWVTDKSRDLGRILLDRGAVDAETHALLAALARKHLQMHGGDLEESLAALSSLGSVREDLERVADPELQTSLTRVPRTHERADPDATAQHARTAGTSTTAGMRFRILRLHSTGGLGAVYVAHDEELHREVALKQIRDRHAHDPDSRSRFLQEAEITGWLEHPGIIPVYGLGTYDDGRPFYAMRFIKGDNLKDAIAHFHEADVAGRDPGERALALRELLGRFVDVCNAMAYAHSRGILHRDLKPSNILLGTYGETLVVDWGLAKPVGRPKEASRTEEVTLRPDSAGSGSTTRQGDTLGTPAYMSPEQAAGDLDRLGLPSDVYSLGATLYCLLTGRAPFEGDVDIVLGKVRSGEFPPPRAVNRAIDPALEAICLKAMALVPEGRYASPTALADDIEHWLADEPVTAWREPFSRRARRWARRHRTAVAATMVALVASVVGLGTVAGVQARANAATNQALAETQAVLEFFQDKVLAAARPEDQEGGLGKDVTLRAAVDAAETGIEKSFADQPTTEASIRNTLGVSYLYLGEPDLAIRQQERALALRRQVLVPDHPDTLISMNNLAVAYGDAGRLPDALALCEETLKRRQAKFGPDHPDTLTSMNNLAMAYLDAGRLTDALPLHEETLKRRQAKLGSDHPDTLTSMNNLAMAYRDAGRFADRLSLFEETLKRRQAKLGADHHLTLSSMNNLAMAYGDAGRLTDALPLYEEMMKRSEAKLGADHHLTLYSMNNLAMAYRDAGRHADALPLFEKALNGFKATFGPDHPNTLTSMNNLARAYLVGKPAQAEPLAREALAIGEKKTPDDWRVFDSRSLLGGSLLGQQKYAEAEPLLLQGYEGMKARETKIPAQSKKNLAEAGARIVELYGAKGEKEKSEEWRRKLDEKTGIDKTTKP